MFSFSVFLMTETPLIERHGTIFSKTNSSDLANITFFSILYYFFIFYHALIEI
jgi:hypothetical protein